MRKDFGAKTWMYPLPVLIVGSYDPVANTYRVLGEVVGKAFGGGAELT